MKRGSFLQKLTLCLTRYEENLTPYKQIAHFFYHTLKLKYAIGLEIKLIVIHI